MLIFKLKILETILQILLHLILPWRRVSNPLFYMGDSHVSPPEDPRHEIKNP